MINQPIQYTLKCSHSKTLIIHCLRSKINEYYQFITFKKF